MGPNLSKSAVQWGKLSDQERREHLLESIVQPAARSPKAFRPCKSSPATAASSAASRAAKPTTRSRLVDPNGKVIRIRRDNIDEMQQSPKSAMPDDVSKQLTRFEIRDLVEFLATLDAAANP